MKDIYKSPIFYYVLVPAVLALWPLLVRTVYLPRANTILDTEILEFEKGQKLIDEILRLEPDRLNYARSPGAAEEFQYDREVHKVASACGIGMTEYVLNQQAPRTSSKGQKSQTCQVTLKRVGIQNFAKFLSEIQVRWAGLECDEVALTKNEGAPDSWKVVVKFKYYY